MENCITIYLLVTGAILLWDGLITRRISAVAFGMFGLTTALIRIVEVYNG